MLLLTITAVITLLSCCQPETNAFTLIPKTYDTKHNQAVSRRFWEGPRSHMSMSASPSLDKTTRRDDIVNQLLLATAKTGQVGSKASEADVATIADLAEQLASLSTVERPADVPLSGVHSLVYSASSGGSSGMLGPFTGRVTQSFIDEKQFINAVTLGPLCIKIYADREVLSDGQRIRLKFRKTTVEIGGFQIIRKELKSSGIWKCKFVEVVGEGQNKRLLRIMETPSLFVIEQKCV